MQKRQYFSSYHGHKNVFRALIFLLTLALFLPIKAAFARHYIPTKVWHSPEVKVYNSINKHVDLDFSGFDESQQRGLTVATGDLNGDRLAEIVVGSGPGGSPEVRVYDKSGKYTGWSVAPFPSDFRGGVDVATGDIDGDGVDEVLVAQHLTGDSWIKAYKFNSDKKIVSYFRAFGQGFSGGINIASGNVLGDAKDEIIVGTSLKNAGRVRIFHGGGTLLNTEFFPITKDYQSGVDVAVGDVVAGGLEEIVTSPENNATARIKVYSISETDKKILSVDAASGERGHLEYLLPVKFSEELVESAVYRETLVNNFVALGEGYKGGAHIAVGNIDGNDDAEILVAKNNAIAPNMTLYSRTGEKKSFDVTPFEKDFEGGIEVAIGDLDGGSVREIIATPSKIQKLAPLNYARYVDVNLSEQRLYAYEYGILANTHLISSGSTFPTYPGNFRITTRQRTKLYVGPDYYLPNTPYNMRFDGPRWLHGAYWHNNFGHPMSHGCLNMPIYEAGWLWDSPMGQSGTPVIVHY